jgi:hypothetical protein
LAVKLLAHLRERYFAQSTAQGITHDGTFIGYGIPLKISFPRIRKSFLDGFLLLFFACSFTPLVSVPMAGVQVKESPKSVDNLTGQPVKSNANSGTVATSPNGTIKDNVVAPLRLDEQPHTVTPEDTQAMKDAANTLPYNRTTDQTLDFSVGKQQCQCTYSETLSNSDSQGNVNQQPNSNGINFTFSHTNPTVQRVEPKKDKEPK